jgi:ABC-type glycerol-3-phosphate transport system permease component
LHDRIEDTQLQKFPARYNFVAMPFVLSLMMSFIISGTSTLRALGIVDGFFFKWMSAWGVSWLVAFPTVLIVLPLVRRVVSIFVEQPER